MKSIKLFLLSFTLIMASNFIQAQEKTETIQVAGECGMCKSKIEKAAKVAGASFADWNVEKKVLTVKYNSGSISKEKIEQAVSDAGYDTHNVKASDKAYSKLSGCCKYDRTASATAEKAGCCQADKCTKADCMKDGSCTADMSCCKNSDCAKMDCCKKA